MFFQYKSDSLFKLAETFSRHVSENKLNHPFQKNWVVIQNKEAQQWLTLQVAANSGIAANFEFILPSELIWKLFRNFYPDTPKILPGDRLPLQWIILDFLTDTDPQVFRRIQGFPEVKNEMQAYRFSVQLADVFDLYQVYRPEMTEGWKQGTLSTKNTQEFWQLWIWREIQDRISIISEVPDRGFVYRQLFQRIKEENIAEEFLIPEITCFGLSQFSKPFAELLSLLSQQIDINYYSVTLDTDFNNLFSEGWSSVNEEWSRPKLNSENLISEFLRPDEIEIIDLESNSDRSIFSKILKQVNTNTLIEIHSCHSPKREVETLKDQLLSMLESDNSIYPEDILVMVPEIKEYAPLIQSVFNSNNDGPTIPAYVPGLFSASDIIAFKKFLELSKSKVKANDFIDFIELEGIREKFSLDEEELSVIKSWISQNNIFWGLDDDDSEFSLKKLSNALISGYITEPEAFDSFGEFIPFDSVSTTDQLELASKLSSLIHQLIELRAEFRKARSPELWMDVFTRAAFSLISSNNTSLFSTLDRLKEALSLSEVTKEVDFAIIYNWILSQLGDIQATSSGFGHGVVISSYIPYRGIPFKYVAILGMNESVFPRNPDRPTFDLIQNDSKPGDRITKEDDALLFLEVLHSTSDHLYISFVGQDLYSENEKLPSVLLQKLMDIASETGSEILIQKEKLHGFNPDYFINAESYSIQRQEIARLINSGMLEQEFLKSGDLKRKEKPERIHVSELIDFCSHPNKYVLQHFLSISGGYREDELSDRELFTIGGLSKWKLNNTLLEAYQKGLNEVKALDFIDKAGMIPKGVPGSVIFSQKSHEVKELLSEIQEFKDNESDIIQCSLKIDDVELYGNIGGVQGDQRVIWRMGKSRPKDLAQLWIEHLILSCENIDYKGTLFITSDDGKVHKQFLKPPEASFSILSALINWFIEADRSEESLTFFVKTSFAYAQKINAGKGEDEATKSAYKEWISDERVSGEEGDFYINLIWNSKNSIESDAFKKRALEFWEPVFKSKVSVK